jgi:hypothetical protein
MSHRYFSLAGSNHWQQREDAPSRADVERMLGRPIGERMKACAGVSAAQRAIGERLKAEHRLTDARWDALPNAASPRERRLRRPARPSFRRYRDRHNARERRASGSGRIRATHPLPSSTESTD